MAQGEGGVDASTPLLGTKQHGSRDESIRLRARILTIIVPMLMGSALQSRESLLAQYLVDRLNHDYNITNGSIDLCHINTSNKGAGNVDTEAETANQLAKFALVQAIPALLACLVFGSYSDFLGRRKLLLIPLFTGLVKLAVTCLVIAWHLPIGSMYPAYALDGLAGSWFTILIAIYSITADVNKDHKARTLSIFAVLAVTAISQAAVNIAMGNLIDSLGFLEACLLITIIMVVAFLLSLCLMPETLRLNQNSAQFGPSEAGHIQDNTYKDTIMARVPQRSSMNPLRHIRRLFGFYIFDGSRRRRVEMTVVLFIFMFPVANEINLPSMDALYQLHPPFCWNSKQIGYYNAIRQGGSSFLGGLWLGLMQRCLPFEVLGMLGVMFQGGALLFEALINKTWLFYFVPAILVPSIPISAIARSILSLRAGPDRQGALFSSIAVVECLIAMLTTVTYNKVFSATTDSEVSGAVYILMACMSVVAVFLYIVFFIVREKPVGHHKSDAEAKSSSHQST